MTRRRSWLGQAAHDTYLISRTLGDASAAESGGAPRLAKRLVRRKVRRRVYGFVGRKTGGWL